MNARDLSDRQQQWCGFGLFVAVTVVLFIVIGGSTLIVEALS